MYTTFYRHTPQIGHFCIRHPPTGNTTNHVTEGNTTLAELYALAAGPIVDITDVSWRAMGNAPNNPPLQYWLDNGAEIIPDNRK